MICKVCKDHPEATECELTTKERELWECMNGNYKPKGVIREVNHVNDITGKTRITHGSYTRYH